jgi:hypothetical protein
MTPGLRLPATDRVQHPQLAVRAASPPATLADYRQAASLLWGAAGRFLVDTYERVNGQYFDDQLPPVPLVIGLTAYGHCIGLTRRDGPWAGPRIAVASGQFRQGTRAVEDVLVHEMVHVKLILAGADSSHNAEPWCREIMRLSPRVLGHPIQAAPVKTRWNPETKRSMRGTPQPGWLSRQALARWPHSCRPGTVAPGPILSTATY